MNDFSQIPHIIDNVLAHSWVKFTASMFMMFVSWLFDDSRGAVPPLIVAGLIIFDFFSGVFAAIYTGEGISSRKFKRTVWKFLVYALAVMTGRMLDKLLPIPCFAVLIEVFLGLTEGQSIIENLGRAGVPFPKKITNIFTDLKERVGEEIETKTNTQTNKP